MPRLSCSLRIQWEDVSLHARWVAMLQPFIINIVLLVVQDDSVTVFL